MSAVWFKPRGYRHLDAPVGPAYASNAERPDFVARHSFLPLLHYVKRIKRYRPKINKTEFKKRPIMYASHRDACILSYYAYILGGRLNSFYDSMSISDCAIAYRKLSKSNYDFAAEVIDFATANAPCAILCFDVTDFFGTLDHRLLKNRLKRILDTDELPADWYAIYRYVTKFCWIDIDDIKKHPEFSERWDQEGRFPIATISELISASVKLNRNRSEKGIPQGTPISSALSNLYMIDFDRAMQSYCMEHGGLYRRYSDDILVICPERLAVPTEKFVIDKIKEEKLVINPDKTERKIFDSTRMQHTQYLGFNLSPCGASIRQSSLSRQWRKLLRSVKRIRRAGEAAISSGKANKIYTKTLRRRFTALQVRNFSSYARRSAQALNSPRIRRQALQLERYVENEIATFPKVE